MTPNALSSNQPEVGPAEHQGTDGDETREVAHPRAVQPDKQVDPDIEVCEAEQVEAGAARIVFSSPFAVKIKYVGVITWRAPTKRLSGAADLASTQPRSMHPLRTGSPRRTEALHFPRSSRSSWRPRFTTLAEPGHALPTRWKAAPCSTTWRLRLPPYGRGRFRTADSPVADVPTTPEREPAARTPRQAPRYSARHCQLPQSRSPCGTRDSIGGEYTRAALSPQRGSRCASAVPIGRCTSNAPCARHLYEYVAKQSSHPQPTTTARLRSISQPAPVGLDRQDLGCVSRSPCGGSRVTDRLVLLPPGVRVTRSGNDRRSRRD